MQIYLASNREKLINFEYWTTLQKAFDNAQQEWESNDGKVLDISQYSTAWWVEDDNDDWEMWVILYHGEAEYKAKLTSFIVYTIEVHE